MSKKKRFVVVTTGEGRRGVFAGTLEKHDPDKETCVLSDAQMCVYWPRSTKGVVGLAATGPTSGSRITPACPRMELNGVTAVMDCTEEAKENWGKQPWE